MLEIIKMVILAIATALGIIQSKQQQDAGSAKTRADNAETTVDEITRANAARDSVRTRNDATPGGTDASSLPDDGFQRD